MMSILNRTARIAVLGFGVMAGQSAAALPPLSEDKYANDWILAGYIGDQIANNCPTIYARKIAAISKLYMLRDRALKQGYSRDEVKAFVDSSENRQMFTQRATAYLAGRGAKPGDAQSYCAIGVQEIKGRTLTGQLIGTR